MFGKGKRQIKNVIFVQPPKGEAYFYTPIAYSTNLPLSKEKNEKQVFTDSDLALVGKLKLIFEREKKCWFEIKEEKSPGSPKNEHYFALYFYPQRLVASRDPPFDVTATLQNIKELFDFIVTEEQNRSVEVHQSKMPLAYTSVEEEVNEESEAITMTAVDSWEEPEEIAVTRKRRKK
jgi:hypothetical protein